MILRPQDLIVCLKYTATADRVLTVAQTAREVGLGVADVHRAIRHGCAARLLAPIGTTPTRGRPVRRLVVHRAALLELLLHGVRYVFIPERGKLARGMPTASGAAPLDAVIETAGPLPVWPTARGAVRGESFSPLHACAVTAASNDPELYALLALIDAIRGGSAREREAAGRLLAERLARG
jgi:hypothetical protein